MKYFCAVVVALSIEFIASSGSAAGGDAAQFAKANQEYAAGHYQQAIEGYETLVRANRWNANLFYNLGNAWFRKGDLGHAILEYERALTLDPQHPEAQANLRLVRDEARALELPKTLWEQYLDIATCSQYVGIAGVAFWIIVFAAAMLFLGSRRSGAAVAVLAMALAVFGGALAALYTIENGPEGRALAIVTDKNVEARLATADNANAVLALPAGSEVKILSRRGEWLYAALPNHLRGWIPAKSAQSVRL